MSLTLKHYVTCFSIAVSPRGIEVPRFHYYNFILTQSMRRIFFSIMAYLVYVLIIPEIYLPYVY